MATLVPDGNGHSCTRRKWPHLYRTEMATHVPRPAISCMGGHAYTHTAYGVSKWEACHIVIRDDGRRAHAPLPHQATRTPIALG
eukprot:scaffold28845_cov123-Isochrysis_galbana.AAC.4